MRKTERAKVSRLHLDVRFNEIGPLKRYAVPTHGWIKAIRQGLGMKSAQLADRLGISQPSVVSLENLKQEEPLNCRRSGARRKHSIALLYTH